MSKLSHFIFDVLVVALVCDGKDVLLCETDGAWSHYNRDGYCVPGAAAM